MRVIAKDLQTPSWNTLVGCGAEVRLWRGTVGTEVRGSTKLASQCDHSPLPWCIGALEVAARAPAQN